MYTCVCKHCRRIFNSRFQVTSCDNCKNLDENNYEAIVEYLKRYPNSNALQIAENLKISAFEILQYVDEGKLQYSRGKFSRLED